MKVRVEELLAQTRTVALPPELSGALGPVSRVILEFGAERVEAKVARSSQAGPGHLAVSGDIVQRLRIPLDCAYRVRAGGGRIALGPVVGILAGRKPEELTADELGAMANHLCTGAAPDGLYFVFDLQSMNMQAGQVRGYRLIDVGEERWAEGIFPLPGVIVRRYGVRLDRYRAALWARGVRFCNEQQISKWWAHKLIAADSRLRAHLPETAYLEKTSTVIDMLERHPVVFIKPSWGSKGAQILRVERIGEGAHLDCAGEQRVVCGDAEALRAALESRMPRRAIVQQGLDLMTVDQRLVDFRVMIQKDGAGRWTVPGMVARCGTASFFVSNVMAGGFPLSAEDGLSLLFGTNPMTIFRRRQELAMLGLAVGEALERSGLLLGDLGLDVAYDPHGYPWIIEVNNRDPNHTIASDFGAWHLFYRCRSLPIEHAGLLAGFGRGATV